MRSKTAAYIELVRAQNLFTAMADPMAGLIVTGSSGIDVFKMPYLLAASALIYAGGSALNDYADRGRDAINRPERPIPSGRVNPGGALVLGAVLIMLGAAASTGAGLFPFLTALGLSAAIVANNTGFKKGALYSALTMGLSRALNLGLGMSAGSYTDRTFLVLPFITFAFVFTITLLGRRLSGGEWKAPGLGVLSGWVAACLAIQFLLFSGRFMGEGALFAALFHVVSALAVISAFSGRALTDSTRQSLMLSIPLLDASFSSGMSGIMAGFPVAAMALPAVALSNRN